jgi:hypothetical protein
MGQQPREELVGDSMLANSFRARRIGLFDWHPLSASFIEAVKQSRLF